MASRLGMTRVSHHAVRAVRSGGATGRCVHHRRPGLRTQQSRRVIDHLKLSFDRGLIDNRPYSPDLLAPKFIEDILGKGNSLPVELESKKRSLRRTVEFQPARDIRRISNQQLNIE